MGNSLVSNELSGEALSGAHNALPGHETIAWADFGTNTSKDGAILKIERNAPCDMEPVGTIENEVVYESYRLRAVAPG